MPARPASCVSSAFADASEPRLRRPVHGWARRDVSEALIELAATAWAKRLSVTVKRSKNPIWPRMSNHGGASQLSKNPTSAVHVSEFFSSHGWLSGWCFPYVIERQPEDHALGRTLMRPAAEARVDRAGWTSRPEGLRAHRLRFGLHPGRAVDGHGSRHRHQGGSRDQRPGRRAWPPDSCARGDASPLCAGDSRRSSAVTSQPGGQPSPTSSGSPTSGARMIVASVISRS